MSLVRESLFAIFVDNVGLDSDVLNIMPKFADKGIGITPFLNDSCQIRKRMIFNSSASKAFKVETQ